MLSAEQNERLTRVGRGTPMGELLRRYWYPVATCQEMGESPVKSVRLLGESLTLFRDRSGRLGLIERGCAHRGVDLRLGIPEPEGLRCPFHGWVYDRTGQCIEQPDEPAGSTFKDRIKLQSYPVEELAGLVWAYLGPEPAPLLPRWDFLVWDNVFRAIWTATVPCNWLNCQEFSVDPNHTEWLHGRYGLYTMERLGINDPGRAAFANRFLDQFDWTEFVHSPYGIVYRRGKDGQSLEEGEPVPTLFPYVGFVPGPPGQVRARMHIPMDDTHTLFVNCMVYFPAPGQEVPQQNPVPAAVVPYDNELTLNNSMQMAMVGVAEGEINDRSVERLGTTDKGVIMFRRMLEEQMSIVEQGGDPINTFRDPVKDAYIKLGHRWGEPGEVVPSAAEAAAAVVHNEYTASGGTSAAKGFLQERANFLSREPSIAR